MNSDGTVAAITYFIVGLGTAAIVRVDVGHPIEVYSLLFICLTWPIWWLIGLFEFFQWLLPLKV
jgi:hypothetical protein